MFNSPSSQAHSSQNHASPAHASPARWAHSWAEWRAFPDPETGGHLMAPIGPGVFEVRDTGTGEQIVFDCSDNVARSLASLAPHPRRGFGLFFRRAANSLKSTLEYRTCPAPTRHEARALVRRFYERRGAYIRRRTLAG